MPNREPFNYDCLHTLSLVPLLLNLALSRPLGTLAARRTGKLCSTLTQVSRENVWDAVMHLARTVHIWALFLLPLKRII